jgi:hypothetical protein
MKESLAAENFEQKPEQVFNFKILDYAQKVGLDVDLIGKNYHNIREYLVKNLPQQYLVSDLAVMEKYFEAIKILKIQEHINLLREFPNEILPKISDEQYYEMFGCPGEGGQSRKILIKYNNERSGIEEKELENLIKDNFLTNCQDNSEQIIEIMKNIPTIKSQLKKFTICYTSRDKYLQGKFSLRRKEPGQYDSDDEWKTIIEYYRGKL